MTDRCDAPSNLRSLTTRIETLARRQQRPVRPIQRAVANTVVGQLLPPGVVKGGTAMKLRVGGREPFHPRLRHGAICAHHTRRFP